jgi:hypothetical protein
MSKHSPKYDIYFLGEIEDPKIYDRPSFSESAPICLDLFRPSVQETQKTVF